MTVLSFPLMYRAGGKTPVIDYAKSLVYTIRPWVLYVLTVVLLCDRIGIWWALVLGVGLYMVTCMGMAYVK